MRKIKVLIVDDSLLFRDVLARGIECDPFIEVVATAADPFEARDKIIEHRPDVMTCDVEMPKMNGIEFIRRLLPQYPIPVIVISTISNAVFDAMAAGAIDFLTKPDVRLPHNMDNFITELITKVKIAAEANLTHLNARYETKQQPVKTPVINKTKLIAIGASTGGTEAIFKLIKNLPLGMPGILIVQHIPPVFSRMFAERLDNFTHFEVVEAKSGLIVEKDKIFVAAGDCHMKIRKLGEDFVINCFTGEKVNGHCPSVDVLFNSVAKEVGPKAIGVILTGMGYDGAKGLLAMRRSGARTIGQDEASSVVYGMPKVAASIGAVEIEASLDNIPHTIMSMLC